MFIVSFIVYLALMLMHLLCLRNLFTHTSGWQQLNTLNAHWTQLPLLLARLSISLSFWSSRNMRSLASDSSRSLSLSTNRRFASSLYGLKIIEFYENTMCWKVKILNCKIGELHCRCTAHVADVKRKIARILKSSKKLQKHILWKYLLMLQYNFLSNASCKWFFSRWL